MYLEGESGPSERDEQNRQIQQFLDERLAGVPNPRSGDERVRARIRVTT
jgi:hypothetical protein